MGKIDTTKISGYDTMSPEEKIAALEAYQYEDNVLELERLKKSVTAANAEAADWKRKHHDLLSEDERNKQIQEDELKGLRAQVEELTKDKQRQEFKAKYIALGYDETLAESTAAALQAGDMETVFANQVKALEAHDRAQKTEAMKKSGTLPPSGSEGGVKMTSENFWKMPIEERAKFSQEHPDEFKEIVGGTT